MPTSPDSCLGCRPCWPPTRSRLRRGARQSKPGKRRCTASTAWSLSRRTERASIWFHSRRCTRCPSRETSSFCRATASASMRIKPAPTSSNRSNTSTRAGRRREAVRRKRASPRPWRRYRQSIRHWWSESFRVTVSPLDSTRSCREASRPPIHSRSACAGRYGSAPAVAVAATWCSQTPASGKAGCSMTRIGDKSFHLRKTPGRRCTFALQLELRCGWVRDRPPRRRVRLTRPSLSDRKQPTGDFCYLPVHRTPCRIVPRVTAQPSTS